MKFTFISSLLILLGSLNLQAQSAAEREWHEHCEMTIHTRVEGWSLEDIYKDIELGVPENGLPCEYEFFDGYGEPGQSSALARFDFAPLELNLGTVGFRYLNYQRYQSGRVSKQEMCREVEDINAIALANGGKLKGTARVERVRQDYITPKNTDSVLIETLYVTFPNGSVWISKNSAILPGKYCSQKPTP